MTFGEKLAKLRKENNHTQEQLASILSVSRQSVSKWESDLAYPETEKLIRISELYHCSVDYLLKDGAQEPAPAAPRSFRLPGYEYKSKKTFRGLPLVHIHFGFGATAKGVVAIGFRAKGLVSLGLASMGLVSFGLFSLGLLAFGVVAAGLLAAGVLALGIIAAGSISCGILALGAIAVGRFSVGALAIGQYGALGDHARAMVALGKSEAVGTLFSHTGKPGVTEQLQALAQLDACVPWYLGWAKAVFSWFL